MSSLSLVQATRHQFTILRVGLMFLTRLPVGSLPAFRTEWLGQSMIYFPLIGALVGSVSAAVAWLLFGHISTWLAMLAVLLTSVLVTGGFHEDALADAADGLVGGQTVERRMEIMKDSRVGTYGVLALWFSLSAKLICLHDLALQDFARLLGLFIVAHALARSSSVGLLYALPYVQREHAKGGAFAQATLGVLFFNLLASTLLAVVLLGSFLGFACLGVLVILTIATGFYFHSKIGGISGDCLGAATQIVEMGCYLAVLVLTVSVTP
jgi:adenosylcobinamide-GDP ribazoletransferase